MACALGFVGPSPHPLYTTMDWAGLQSSLE